MNYYGGGSGTNCMTQAGGVGVYGIGTNWGGMVSKKKWQQSVIQLIPGTNWGGVQQKFAK